MRRYVFYFAVGVVTFTASFLSYISITMWKVARSENEGVERIKQAEISQRRYETGNLFLNSEASDNEQKDGFRCEDKFLLAVWNHLLEDEGLKEVFDDGIRQNDLNDCAEVVGIDRLIDLNEDGNQEAVVTGRGWLNGLSEKSTWIVTRNAENYKVILDNAIGVYEIKKQKTKGFQDIFVSFKISIEESEKILYRFEGRSYKPVQCWNEIIAARDRREQTYEIKKPRKIAWHCWK